MSTWLGIWISLWRWRWRRDAGAEIARRAKPVRDVADEQAIAALQERMRLIQQVARWMPQSRCLDRALTLIEWADACSVPAQLCIGVERNAGRMQAHAWVQCGAHILDPDPESTRRFVRLEAHTAPMEFDR